MRRGIALAALLLPLGGCVVPPASGPYGYGGYPQPVPGYGGEDYSYPGYAYNAGSPTLYAEGVTWPLIFYGGQWGYWDRGHRWHGAPDGVRRNLEMRHPAGVGYRPYGGGQFGRPEGPRFSGPPGGFHPGGPQPGGFRPGGPQPSGFHPGGPPPGGFHPGGAPPGAGPRPGPSPTPANHPTRHREDEHR